MRDELIDGANLTTAVFWIGISKEEIRRKRDFFLQLSAENVIDRHAPFLPQDVETSEFERG